jgi:hypothetical protein
VLGDAAKASQHDAIKRFVQRLNAALPRWRAGREN